MKNIFSFTIILAFLLTVFTACKTTNRNADSEINPNHKKRPESPIVKSIKRYSRTGKTGTDTLLQTEEFDEKGFLVKQVKYGIDGKPEYELQNINNKDGKPVKVVTKYPDGTTHTEEHTYNKDGKIIITKWQRSDGTNGRHEYKYDDEGNIEKWDWFEGNKFVISRLYPAIYTDNGKPLESFYRETSNNKDTTTVNHYQYSYDSLNRLTRKLSMENYYPIGLDEFIYDSIGNKIVEIYYLPDSANSGTMTLDRKQFNIYNEYGEFIQYKTAKGRNAIDATVTNAYDDYGHLIQTTYEYADGTYRIERNVYEFYKK